MELENDVRLKLLRLSPEKRPEVLDFVEILERKNAALGERRGKGLSADKPARAKIVQCP